MAKQCADCRDGEHKNYDDNVLLVIIRDGENLKFVKRSCTCEHHRQAYFDDGYTIQQFQENIHRQQGRMI